MRLLCPSLRHRTRCRLAPCFLGRGLLGRGLLLAAIGAIGPACGPTSQDLAALHADVLAVRSDAVEAEAAWRGAVSDWIARDEHSGEACPLENLDPAAVGTVSSNMLEETLPAFLRDLQQIADVLEAQILVGPSAAELPALEESVGAAQASLASPGIDVLFLLQEQGTPSYRAGVLTPGMIRGWMLAYDYASEAVVCAGRIHETNRPDVLQRIERDATLAERFALEPDAVLLEDLYDAAWENAIENVAAVTP